jgi:hypothetical protein
MTLKKSKKNCEWGIVSFKKTPTFASRLRNNATL